MSKIQKTIILLFLVCHYTVLGSLPSTEEELINYGKWLKNTEVTDDMKNNWRNQRDQSSAYCAKAGRVKDPRGKQKPSGNILVAPFEGDRMIVFRSSIYPLGHIYRAYDSRDLADLLLGKESSRTLKLTDYLYKQISSLKVLVDSAVEITDPEKKIEKFNAKLENINKDFQKIKEPPEEYNAYLPLLNNNFFNFNFDIKDKDINTKVMILNDFNNILEGEYTNLHSSITKQLQEYVRQLIEYLKFLKENKLLISALGEEDSICDKMLEWKEYTSLNKGLQSLEKIVNKDTALAHTEMMFRYYICKNRLTPPENIYSYLDLCNKCEQVLAKDISIYTEERGFYAVSEVEYNANTNHTTPDSLLKKYRLLPIYSETVDDSKTEEKSSAGGNWLPCNYL